MAFHHRLVHGAFFCCRRDRSKQALTFRSQIAMAVHGDLHRTFIQIVLSRKILPLTEFEELVRYCQRKFDVPLNPEGNLQALAKFVSDVNNRLSPFHMRLKSGVSEEDGSHFYALVNIRDDALSKCATKFSGNEMKFFKKLVLKIAESNCGRITSTAALNIVYEDGDSGLQIRTAQALIDRMVSLGCLTVEEGNVSLAPLTLLELEPYLREQLGDAIPQCDVCKQICIKGELCSNPELPCQAA
nr:non-structural maintenance of chromosomes element 1 homolog [Rhipicephalus microplus]